MQTIYFRVTSVYQFNKSHAYFSGVPLEKGSFKVGSGKQIIVVKTTPDILPMEPTVGQHWCVTGKIESRKTTHGDFIITENHFNNPEKAIVTLPHDGESFIRFIAKEIDFKGIGEVKARELWTTFGKKVFKLIESKDTTRLGAVLTDKAILSLIEGYEKYANLKYSTWFSDRKIPPQIQQRLFKYHGRESVQTIEENPYVLVGFGMTFENVDNLSQGSFCIGLDDERRKIAAVEFSLKQHSAQQGHTVASHKELFPLVKGFLKNNELTKTALAISHSKRTYWIDIENGTYHHTPLLIMERVVAKRLLKLNAKETQLNHQFDEAFKYATQDLPFPLAEKQLDAVLTSMEHSVSCITGGAGTGKTTVLRTVLRGYNRLGYEIKAIALSGRAAKRLHESVGFETSTIAKFLRDEPIKDDSPTIIVIDEASMLDLATMYRIIIHTDPSVRFLFVGDYNQLPPIGCGLILADIVRSGVIPTTELDIVQRQDETTGIPEYSRLICQGKVPSELSTGNIHFHETPLDDVADVCIEIYAQDPVNSRVVAATKNTVNQINLQCQQTLNKQGDRLEFHEFGDHYKTDLFCNDPVLFTQNNYEAGVQNGTLGKLISVEQTEEHFGLVVIEGDGSIVPLTRALLDSLQAGYCITLHKAQGSQFKRVIVPLGRSRMLDRAWLYTAITRSEEELFIVGTKKRFEQAIRSLSAHHKRQTHLAFLLKNSK
ncbi:MAG: exodeoxyribonuclease V alpha subunit [Shewanella sp.]|jgi:exodeoxyribonuclease V alpha subunit